MDLIPIYGRCGTKLPRVNRKDISAIGVVNKVQCYYKAEDVEPIIKSVQMLRDKKPVPTFLKNIIAKLDDRIEMARKYRSSEITGLLDARDVIREETGL